MILKELVDKFDWKVVKQALIDAYPDEKKKNFKGYKLVLETLKLKEPKENDMRIFVTLVEDWYDKGEFYTHVDGKNGRTWFDEWKEHPEWSSKPTPETEGHEISWAIEYTPWDEWLGMKIDPVSFNGANGQKGFSEVQIVAYCLWEMTWAGFTEEKIKKGIDELNDSANEIKEAIANGTIDGLCKPMNESFDAVKEKVKVKKQKD